MFGDVARFQEDPPFRDHVPFYEYFHGDNGRGVGASHQTGWTGLVTELLGSSSYATSAVTPSLSVSTHRLPVMRVRLP